MGVDGVALAINCQGIPYLGEDPEQFDADGRFVSDQFRLVNESVKRGFDILVAGDLTTRQRPRVTSQKRQVAANGLRYRHNSLQALVQAFGNELSASGHRPTSTRCERASRKKVPVHGTN
jgi:single-stranded DNA-binding protein